MGKNDAPSSSVHLKPEVLRKDFLTDNAGSVQNSYENKLDSTPAKLQMHPYHPSLLGPPTDTNLLCHSTCSFKVLLVSSYSSSVLLSRIKVK